MQVSSTALCLKVHTSLLLHPLDNSIVAACIGAVDQEHRNPHQDFLQNPPHDVQVFCVLYVNDAQRLFFRLAGDADLAILNANRLEGVAIAVDASEETDHVIVAVSGVWVFHY
eukprot:2850698-Amphidinium_carterae.1